MVDPPQSASLGSKALPEPGFPLTPPTEARQPLPFGKYLLLDRIGVGGMAEVWRARVRGAGGFERLVAIKRILPSIAEDERFIAMFIEEARLCGQLSHPHIGQVYELGQQEGSYFLAMEYIPGKDLRALFEKGRRQGEPAPLALVAYCMSRLAEGLDFAHRQHDAAGKPLELVHLDVSPQNVVVSYEGDVKLIDFGIAKAAGMAPRSRADILKGKFAYMSPEQVRGLPLDRRSDLFALGVCLWELLTGERLFEGETDFAVLEQVREAQVLPPSAKNPRIPPELDRIVLRALARDVAQRYAHASELAEDLRRFLAAEGGGFSRRELGEYMRATFSEEIQQEQQRLRQFSVQGQGEGSAPPPVPPRRHSLRRRALAAVISLAALGGAGAAGHALRREPPHGFVLLDVPAELRGLARVNVNGEDLGVPTTWPLLHKVPAGPGVLRVSAPGREPFLASVQVAEAPQLTKVNATPQPRAQQVPVVIRTEPADAELRLDGRVVRPAGEARVYVGALPAGGAVQLEVRAEGYLPHVQRLQPVAGEPLQLDARLQSEAVAGQQFP